MNLADLLGTLIGFLLTLFVLSYIFGDNALFRSAIYIFIGVAAGYSVVLVVYNVIWHRLILAIIQEPRAPFIMVIPPLLAGIWLFSKVSPRLTRFGNPVVAYLVGVGAATTIGGAVLGTIFPQVNTSITLLDLKAARAGGTNIWVALVTGTIILVGTLTTLIYFHFGARQVSDQAAERQPWIEGLSKVGQVFIAITFGTLFAGVYTAALTAFIERIQFLWNTIWVKFLPFIFP